MRVLPNIPGIDPQCQLCKLIRNGMSYIALARGRTDCKADMSKLGFSAKHTKSHHSDCVLSKT
jgi:hypothetical protein